MILLERIRLWERGGMRGGWRRPRANPCAELLIPSEPHVRDVAMRTAVEVGPHLLLVDREGERVSERLKIAPQIERERRALRCPLKRIARHVEVRHWLRLEHAVLRMAPRKTPDAVVVLQRGLRAKHHSAHAAELPRGGVVELGDRERTVEKPVPRHTLEAHSRTAHGVCVRALRGQPP